MTPATITQIDTAKADKARKAAERKAAHLCLFINYLACCCVNGVDSAAGLPTLYAAACMCG